MVTSAAHCCDVLQLEKPGFCCAVRRAGFVPVHRLHSFWLFHCLPVDVGSAPVRAGLQVGAQAQAGAEGKRRCRHPVLSLAHTPEFSGWRYC